VIADYQGEDGATGVTSILAEENKIIVQVREPYGDDDLPNTEVLNHTFLVVLCHEFTHCCQALTGRQGVKAKLMMEGDPDYAGYYFDPEEIEARIMDEFYVQYVPDSLWASIRSLNAKEDT